MRTRLALQPRRRHPRKGPILVDYAEDGGIEGRSLHGLLDSIAVHPLEAGRVIAYVVDHLDHTNIQNTKI